MCNTTRSLPGSLVLDSLGLRSCTRTANLTNPNLMAMALKGKRNLESMITLRAIFLIYR